MALLVVTSASPGVGKTGIATAIARHYAYQGRPVQLARVASPEGNAAEDAASFAELPFVPGSSAGTVLAENVQDPGGEAILVVEADAEAAAKVQGASVVFVARGERPGKLPDGIVPVAIVANGVPRALLQPPAEEEGKPLIIDLPEDGRLAGFSIAELQRRLSAEILVEGDVPYDVTCDTLVIAPYSSDAGQPYLRRFPNTAVVVRYDRTDMHLAAIRADAQVLVLTGGRRPSDYSFDAAGAHGVPLLLSRTDTENTVIALEGIYEATRFMGERKLDRMVELLEETPLFAALKL